MTELRPGTSPPPVRIPIRLRGCSSIRHPNPRRGQRSVAGRRDGAPTPGLYSPAHELRAVHGRGAGGGAQRDRPRASARTPRSPSSTRRWSPGPMTASRSRTTRRPTPSSSPSARPPGSSAASASPTRRSSRRIEPCAMCVGALLESDVEALVYAVPNTDRRRGRDRDPARPAPGARRGGSRSSAASAATRPKELSRRSPRSR